MSTDVNAPVSPLTNETWRVSHLGPDYLVQQEQGKTKNYQHVFLREGDKYRKFYVHRLVIEAFVGGRPYVGATMNHKDGVKTNNHYANLEWASRKEQAVHCNALGLRNVKGSRNGRAMITEREVALIRASENEGATAEAVAAALGISKNTVWDIRARRTWSHL